ncbi:MAG: small multidrug resistance family-3 protein [Psychromonas sp.]|jgi:small multidrug resistance family-3 protein
MEALKIFGLFTVTAVAEIVGCYLPYLWLRQGHSIWLLIPATFSLAAFVWLLTLHPEAAGRTYAAYGGIYISVALMWLWLVESTRPTMTDLLGVAICLVGVAVIMFGPRPA